MKEHTFQECIVRLDRLQCALRHAYYGAKLQGDPKAAEAARQQLEAAQAEAVAILNNINRTQKEAAK